MPKIRTNLGRILETEVTENNLPYVLNLIEGFTLGELLFLLSDERDEE